MIARIVVVLVVLVVGGCVGAPTGEQERPATSSPTPPGGQARPQDRDREAVLAALREVDLCAVLDAPDVTNDEPVASEPFSCTAGPVRVAVVPLGHEERVSMAARVVGGVKAYVDDRCVVHLPVSFTVAVAFSAGGSCQAVTEVAARASAVLADPAAARGRPRWDPCTVLDAVLEPEPDRLFLGTELGACQYLGVAPEQEALLSFVEPTPAGRARAATVGGTDVAIYEDDDNCGIRWRQRPFDSPYAQTQDYPVTVFSVDCAYSTRLAEGAIGLLGQPAPRGEPQRPLLYGPDEPDGPYLGYCAYLADDNDARRCEPARDVPVPDELTGTDDPQVMCAMAAGSVRERFGEALRPVAVAGEGCHFVGRERVLVVTFAVRKGVLGDGEVTTVAGRRAVVETRDGGIDHAVAAGDGVVELTVEVGPAGAELPAGSDTKAEAVIGDLVG